MYRPNVLFCPADGKVIKAYCSKVLQKKNTIWLDIKKLRKPLKPAVIEVRQHSYILEIKLLI